MSTVAAVVAIVALLATYLTWTAERIDRLNLRVERADASLDAQLVRRSAAVEAVAATPAIAAALPARQLADLRAVALAARASETHTGDGDRWSTENALTVRVLEAVLSLRHSGADASPAAAEVLADLAAAAQRVDLARSFYNQAVRDAREHRARIAPRLLHLAGRAALPQFVDMDDATLPEVAEQPALRAHLP